jgi:hypothetical protein
MTGSRRRRGTDFSRLPRVTDRAVPVPSSTSVPDQQGRRALFSPTTPDAVGEPPAGVRGAVVVDCGSCGERTVLSPTAALSHAIPSLHLPYLRPGHGSWMRCPACRQRTWVGLHLQV